MSSGFMQEPVSKRDKRKAYAMIERAFEIKEQDDSKEGILLCEGNSNSIDVSVYSLIYPTMVVIPVGGCAEVKRLLPRVKKYLRHSCDFDFFAFGLIDRDDLSKKEIRALKQIGIYCTKLPFIENIICTPEVLKILCRIYKRDYEIVTQMVKLELMKTLYQQIKNSLPINIFGPSILDITRISIQVETRGYTEEVEEAFRMGHNVIEKKITLDNVMHSYRDKAIASRVGNALGIYSRDNYYNMIKKQIQGVYGSQMLYHMAKYLPERFIEQGRT